jgi:hypothetical protein
MTLEYSTQEIYLRWSVYKSLDKNSVVLTKVWRNETEYDFVGVSLSKHKYDHFFNFCKNYIL